MKTRKEKIWIAVLSFMFLILSLIMLMPFMIMISTSLKTSFEIQSGQMGLIPKSWQFTNYITAMTNGKWLLWFFNTLYISVVVVAASLLFNTMAGFTFARMEFFGKKIIFMSILLGLMVQPQITLVPVFIILKNTPLAGGNDLLGHGGTGLINTYLGMMIPKFVGAFGIFLSRQYFITFPKSLDEAATIDGCSKWRIYTNIYLPLSGPLLASLGVLKFTGSWNDYIWPLVLTTSENMRTLQLAIAMFRNEVVEWELLMAATSVIILPLVILFIFTQRFFVGGLMAGSVKG